ncbi:MAG: hypothetical protein HGA65_05715, partial [Oscillochloris sp.]|nr:hypothetical protein [Oscillochloris sp.]
MRAFPRLSRQQPTLLVAAGLLLLLLWLAAYQLPSHLTLLMGGDVAHQRRFDEDAFVRLINGSEPPDSAPCRDDPNTRCWWWQLLAPGEDPYRWTSGDTRVSVPGIGGGPYVAAILARGQPTPQATPSTWQVGDLALQVDLPPSQIRRYHFLIPNQPSGDLDLSLRTQPYASPGDPRELGFVIYALRVAQVGSEPRTPAWSQIAWLAFFLAATYAVPRILSVGRHPSLIFAVSLGLISALALALARPLITVFTPTLAAMAAAALLLAALGWLLTRRLGQRAAFVRQVWALTLLSLVLRVGGVLHPHALYSDSMFHANKLYKLSLGQVFQTAGLPSEAGGGEAPYPTGAYLLLLPGQLIPDLPRLRLVQVG